MSKEQEIAEQVWNLFAGSKAELRTRYLSNISALPVEEQVFAHFSDFDPAHKERADRIRRIFQEISTSKADPAKGILAVISEFEQLKQTENPDLLFYALQSFVVHYKGALNLSIPSILVREPESLVPSKTSTAIVYEIAVGSADETKMDWFREDPLLNEHHAHWHVVYDTETYRDRQGEMFFYMHQQMLARYDTERLSLGLKKVTSFSNYAAGPILAGYIAGDDERLTAYEPRAAGVSMPENVADTQQALVKMITDDIKAGEYDPDPSNPDQLLAETSAVNNLGATIEPNVQALNKNYSGYHSWGHMMISALSGDIGGVMRNTVTAIRDVVFWEWHRGIDDFCAQLQDRFSVNFFSADAPPVRLRKSVDQEGKAYSGDLITCLASDIVGYSSAGFDGSHYGNMVFGGENWNTDFGSGSGNIQAADGKYYDFRTTDTLFTEMKEGVIKYINADGDSKEYSYPYLNHEEFCYFIRVENTTLQEKSVTIRMFLVLEGHEEDKRLWVEMDKFLHTLKASSKTVVFRRDKESSVIRKPAVGDPATHNISFNPDDISRQTAECDCGWPYHLLLPRGGKIGNGLSFKLLTVITDGEIDLVGAEPECGSLSFCGTRTDEYPDKRPLGYPFNRPFPAGGDAIKETIRSSSQMAMRSIFIKQKA